MTKLEQYLEIYLSMRQKYPTWRVGQCMYNALHELDPEIAKEIHGTTLDMFYRTPEKHKADIIGFWSWLAARLSSTNEETA